MWGDIALAISGYQIMSAANRTVENITSASVVVSSTQQTQRVSALQTSQLTKTSSKIREDGATTTASGMCSASSATA